jgi:hypothetical protein
MDRQGAKRETGRDNSVLLSFIKNEMQKMIQSTGFELLEMNDRSSYAFDTFVVLAKKQSDYGNV